MATPLTYRATCGALRGLAPRLAARPEMQAEWARLGMTQSQAAGLLERRFASEETRAARSEPAALGDLLHALTPAERDARDRATHRLDGKRYEELAPMVKHRLLNTDRARYHQMRGDWERRGKPLAKTPPTSVAAAVLELAREAGVDTSGGARPDLRVVH